MIEPAFFATSKEFRKWLERNASEHTELLVGFYKVDSGKQSMSWPESVDEALCYGWIDGVRKRIDDNSYQIRFTPRKPTSIWSSVNIAKFHQLQTAGRVQPAGAAAFLHRTEAKSAIYAYEQESTASLSQDEEREFKKNRAAWKFLEGAPPSYRQVVLHWVVRAKKPETRAARLAKLFEACAAGKRLR
jgi:uncharacterized protein YdeI (YjbR/CyaY-like superfamily)